MKDKTRKRESSLYVRKATNGKCKVEANRENNHIQPLVEDVQFIGGPPLGDLIGDRGTRGGGPNLVNFDDKEPPCSNNIDNNKRMHQLNIIKATEVQ